MSSISNIWALLKSCRYIDAISLSIDYAYSRFEEDDKLFLEVLRLCSHQNYKDWHEELLYQRDIHQGRENSDPKSL